MLNIYSQQNRNEETTEEEKKPVKSANKKVSYRAYVDSSGELGGKELERGIWVVSHRVLIYRLIVGTLVAIGGILWIISLVKWTMFFLDWQKQTKTLNQLAVFPNYTKINPSFTPENLQILNSWMFVGGEKKYDAVSEVANPNKRYLVKFEYYYSIGEGRTEKKTAVLLPGETSLIAILGLGEEAAGLEAIPVIGKTSWSRIDAHEVPDTNVWQKERLDLTVADFKFTSASYGDELAANQITFDLTNNSPFGYVEPEFYVGLLDNENLVGVMPLTVSGLKSGETKKIDLRNFVRSLRANDIKLYPLINVYDKEVYTRPE